MTWRRPAPAPSGDGKGGTTTWRYECLDHAGSHGARDGARRGGSHAGVGSCLGGAQRRDEWPTVSPTSSLETVTT
jgi:hypothetical protein